MGCLTSCPQGPASGPCMAAPPRCLLVLVSFASLALPEQHHLYQGGEGPCQPHLDFPSTWLYVTMRVQPFVFQLDSSASMWQQPEVGRSGEGTVPWALLHFWP